MPPFAPTFANPFTGFILPGAGASGINIIDNALENPTVQQWNLGTRVKLPRRLRAARRPRAQPRHALHHRPARSARSSTRSWAARTASSTSSRASARATTRCSRRLEKRWGSGQQLRLSYTPGAGQQLRERRPDPVRRRPDRPERPRARVRPHAQRAAAPAGAVGLASCCRVELRLSPHLDDRARRADGHPDARRVEPRADSLAQRRRRASSRPPGELNAYLTTLNAAGGIDGVPLPLVGDDARFSDSFNSLDLRLSRRVRGVGARPPRGDRRVLQRLQRHEHPRRVQDATTRASRTCWCATAPTRRIPASCARRRSAAR